MPSSAVPYIPGDTAPSYTPANHHHAELQWIGGSTRSGKRLGWAVNLESVHPQHSDMNNCSNFMTHPT